MTPREIAIAIRQRCLKLHITPKRIFFESGVPLHKYKSWRFEGINPKPDDLEKLEATLRGYEHG